METPPPENVPLSPLPDGNRRQFLQKATCMALGGAATVVPAGIGISVLISPLFKETARGLLVRLTPIEALEPGGKPQLFKVVAERKDAWTRHPLTEVGSVFVQRTGEGTTVENFRIFSASCPHLGCAVEYLPSEGNYSCPCHNSTFASSGAVLNPESPSPRGLDALRGEVRDGDLWVEYLNFKANIKEQIPVV